jgi:ribonucleoside-diphosphate reductase alpha chain
MKKMKICNNVTYRRVSGCGNLYVTVGVNEFGEPHQIFIQNEGGCASTINTLARYISEDLRDHTRSLESIVKQLRKSPCRLCLNGGSDGKSCCHIVADILDGYKITELDCPF